MRDTALDQVFCHHPTMNLELERILETVRDEYGLPSIAATAFVGRDVWSAALGVRKFGADEPVTINDNYHLGSVGKSFTATVAAKLVEDGALRWNSRLEEHFSDIEMRDEYRTVTLEMLLSHRAGMVRDATEPSLYNPDAEPDPTRLLYVTNVLAQAPIHAPGTLLAYSNAGFSTAALMLERVAQKPFQTLLSEVIFEPLGMTSACFSPSRQPDAQRNRGDTSSKGHDC